MSLVQINSLAVTLDKINDAFFYGRKISAADRREASDYIASRQGLPHSYANMFAATDYDFKNGLRLYTGEMIPGSAALRHVIGEESCRALILLDDKRAKIKDALKRATEGILRALDNEDRKKGFFCCGKCTDSLLRHWAAGGLKDQKGEIHAGLKVLKKYRTGDGRWARYFYYYSLLALSEIDDPLAVGEIKYAKPVFEKVLKRKPTTIFHVRRRELVSRLLKRC